MSNEICVRPNGRGGAHCWHHGTTAYMSNPPQWDEVCCHCGQIRRMMQPEPLPDPKCGPHAPEPWP